MRTGPRASQQNAEPPLVATPRAQCGPGSEPKEIAYYVAPTQPRAENGLMASDFALSKPAIVPGRREVWYSDGATGFYVVRVAPEVWPAE